MASMLSAVSRIVAGMTWLYVSIVKWGHSIK